MAIWIFSLTRFWPMYSSRRFGRTLTSMRASSSNGAPDTIRSGCRDAIIRLLFLQAFMPSHARIKGLTQRSRRSDTEHGEILKNGIFLYVRAARPFGALKDCNDALS